jgi:hypothetical protein
MDDLLSQFEVIFATPVGLPPSWDHYNCIRLLPGMEPVAVRPYRYAHHQKEELKRQCHDLLAQGVIRPSTSAFLSAGASRQEGKRHMATRCRL